MKVFITFLFLAHVAYSVASETETETETERERERESEIKIESTADLEEPKRIFLGGSYDWKQERGWREEIIDMIEAFKDETLTYFNPIVKPYTADEAQRKKEAIAKNAAEVLFYVLDTKTRGTISVIEVAFGLARGQGVSLAMDNFKDGDLVADEKLTPNELQTLQNARNDLLERSKAHGVPKFSAAQYKEAMTDTIQKLKEKYYVQEKLPQTPTFKRIVIPPSLSLMEMIEAASSLGKGEKPTVCINYLPDRAVIDGKTLSERTIQDYNRARDYLGDLAKEFGTLEAMGGQENV